MGIASRSKSIFLISLLLVLLTSCSKPSDPPPPSGTDTTNHDLSWQIDTLGNGSSSALYDVAIIDENNVWAVGNLSFQDSSGTWRNPPSNIAVWNGSEWTYQTTTDSGFGYGEIYCIFAFSADDIWVGSTIPEHWDGQKWTFHGAARGYPGGFRIRKIWGRNSREVYFVGDEGNIRFFDGSTWTRVESGTTTDLLDISGTDVDNIWVSGYDQATFGSSVLLHVSNQLIEKRYEYVSPYPGIESNRLTGLVTSVWTNSSSWLLALDGGNVWRLPFETRGEGSMVWPRTRDGGFLTRIRGSAANDVFVVGHFGEFGHFNGSSWHWYSELVVAGGRTLHSVAAKGDLANAVGASGDGAVIVMGKR